MAELGRASEILVTDTDFLRRSPDCAGVLDEDPWKGFADVTVELSDRVTQLVTQSCAQHGIHHNDSATVDKESPPAETGKGSTHASAPGEAQQESSRQSADYQQTSSPAPARHKQHTTKAHVIDPSSETASSNTNNTTEDLAQALKHTHQAPTDSPKQPPQPDPDPEQPTPKLQHGHPAANPPNPPPSLPLNPISPLSPPAAPLATLHTLLTTQIQDLHTLRHEVPPASTPTKRTRSSL